MRKNKQSIELPNKGCPLKGDDGCILKDKEFLKVALNAINDYEKEHGTPPPIEPKFVQFLKEMNEATNEDGVTVNEYKNKHILKFNNGDYSIFFNK